MPQGDTQWHRPLLAVCQSGTHRPQRAARPCGRHARLAHTQHPQRHSGPLPRGGAVGCQHQRRHHLSPADRTGLLVQSRTGQAEDPPDGHHPAQDGWRAVALADGRRVPHAQFQPSGRVVWRGWLPLGRDGHRLRARSAARRPAQGRGSLLEALLRLWRWR